MFDLIFSKEKSFKNQFLTPRIHKVDYILTDTESSAFLLEASLIKKYKPRYNVRLKDDKSYPYIRCSLTDPFPRFYMERRIKQKGSIYFGPYTEAFFIRRMIHLLNEQFKIRDCSNTFMKSRKKPCLTYHIGHCRAPCVNLVKANDYMDQVKKALDFLKGKNQEKTLTQLKNQMKKRAEEERFEEAGRLRDRIKAIKLCQPSLIGDHKKLKNADIWAFYGEEQGLIFQTLHIRENALTGQRFQYLPKAGPLKNKTDPVPVGSGVLSEELMNSILFQYYIDNLLPDLILLPLLNPLGGKDRRNKQVNPVWNFDSLTKGLSKIRGKPIQVRLPKSREEKNLSHLAFQNGLSRFKMQSSKQKTLDEGLKEIQKVFRLKNLPFRIECFDVSHFQGQATSASQVVFENGVPKKSDYRKYQVQTAKLSDDFSALKEVLVRRFHHKEYEEPDLLIVDGGKGQLKSALLALKETGYAHIPSIALAKKKTKSDFKSSEVKKGEERFYIPHRKNPIIFPSSSPALNILTHLRDEAHRFALTYHKKRRHLAFRF